MVRLGTNGSGVEIVIVGCPFCDKDGTDNMRFYNTYWMIDPNWDKDRYSFRISYCPFCGNFLPNIEKWEIKNPNNQLQPTAEKRGG